MSEDPLRAYMDEWRDFGYLLIRARWTMRGARTLHEAAQRFRDRAAMLERLALAGFELDEPAADGFAIAIRPGEESPMRLVEGVSARGKRTPM